MCLPRTQSHDILYRNKSNGSVNVVNFLWEWQEVGIVRNFCENNKVSCFSAKHSCNLMYTVNLKNICSVMENGATIIEDVTETIRWTTFVKKLSGESVHYNRSEKFFLRRYLNVSPPLIVFPDIEKSRIILEKKKVFVKSANAHPIRKSDAFIMIVAIVFRLESKRKNLVIE